MSASGIIRSLFPKSSRAAMDADLILESKIATLLIELRDQHPRDPKDADSSDLAAEIVRQIIPGVRAQALRDFAGIHRPACVASLLAEANRIDTESHHARNT